MEAQTLLIADLEHFGDSMLKNEEVGEKRFDFFVSLVTAVVAGLVALATSESLLVAKYLGVIAQGALAILLAIGLLSYMRMLHRNRVTDEYQRTLKSIRDIFKTHSAELGDYKVPVRTDHWAQRWLKGGYAETFGVIDGALLSGFMLCRGSSRFTAAGFGLLFSAGLWIVACRRNK